MKYIIGFDYGHKRIGVAVGQNLTATARPLATVLVKNQQIDWVHITTLIEEWHPEILVVGLPKYADGSDSVLTKTIYHFNQQLRKRYQLPVYTVDETLSSVTATEWKKEKKSKVGLDAIAAQIILETWLGEW